MNQYARDPKRKWKRKNYDESKLHKPLIREDFELETDRDLDKPLEQLVCDVHEETNKNNRTPIENIAHAQKRMVSMMARIAKSNEKLTKWIIGLTVVIIIMTLIMLIKK
jgi:hypothetical protein